jgi:hypothetical protein
VVIITVVVTRMLTAARIALIFVIASEPTISTGYPSLRVPPSGAEYGIPFARSTRDSSRAM